MLKELKFEKCVFKVLGRGLDFQFPGHQFCASAPAHNLLSRQETAHHGHSVPFLFSARTLLSLLARFRRLPGCVGMLPQTCSPPPAVLRGAWILKSCAVSGACCLFWTQSWMVCLKSHTPCSAELKTDPSTAFLCSYCGRENHPHSPRAGNYCYNIPLFQILL